ncbi:MAG: hypothetical protein KAS72_08250 [Phycisphaerales bacterium]|nr:hypothetical protein [Phycisphaerales bacterium]
MPRPRTTLLLPLLVFAAIVLALLVWRGTPNSMPHPMNEQYVTLHYVGLGLTDGDGPLGKRYIAVTMRSPDDDGLWRCEFDGPGYNAFKSYYPDGTLSEEGACLVEVMGLEDAPYPDRHDLQWSRSYRPDGTQASEVVDGTGVQTIWTPGGIKTWELELRNYQRAKLSWWYPNGQLLTVQTFDNGKRHGSFVSYHDNGQKKLEGAYDHDARIGTWTRYGRDGSVESVEEYD